MDVVFGHMPPQDLYIVGSAYFAYEVADAVGYFADEHRLAVLRRPYEVVFEVEYRMGGFAIEFHAS